MRWWNDGLVPKPANADECGLSGANYAMVIPLTTPQINVDIKRCGVVMECWCFL
jgi:hypothetical protein